MIRRELSVPRAITSVDIRKGRTLISLVRCFARRLRVASSARTTGLLLCLAPQLAHASEPATAGTVLVVFEAHTQAASQRLSQEIESLGFSVQLIRDGEAE